MCNFESQIQLILKSEIHVDDLAQSASITVISHSNKQCTYSLLKC